MTRLTKNEIEQVKAHARRIATDTPHRANGGVAVECLDPVTDLRVKDDRPNAKGREKLRVWNEEYFSIIPQSSYDSHQPR